MKESIAGVLKRSSVSVSGVCRLDFHRCNVRATEERLDTNVVEVPCMSFASVEDSQSCLSFL